VRARRTCFLNSHGTTFCIQLCMTFFSKYSTLEWTTSATASSAFLFSSKVTLSSGYYKVTERTNWPSEHFVTFFALRSSSDGSADRRAKAQDRDGLGILR
jgi:hypothetical protein